MPVLLKCWFFENFLKCFTSLFCLSEQSKITDHSLIFLDLAGSCDILDIESIQACRYRTINGFFTSFIATYLPAICLFIIHHSIQAYLSMWGSWIKKYDEVMVLAHFALVNWGFAGLFRVVLWASCTALTSSLQGCAGQGGFSEEPCRIPGLALERCG